MIEESYIENIDTLYDSHERVRYLVFPESLEMLGKLLLDGQVSYGIL